MKFKIKPTILLAALFMSCSLSLKAQFENQMYTCDAHTYSLLSDLGKSQFAGGKIYLFTTTHQDLAWLKNLDSCIADRDTLWLTPFLQRLQDDPTFKMDIEQTSIVMEYLHRHPESKQLFDKYIAEGRICVGGTFIQPYEEMYSGESLARQFYFGTRWLKKNFSGYSTRSYFNVDVPGRTLQMPQIMQKAGVDNLVISRHERGLFYWKAPDGSKVRTYSPGHYIFFYDVMSKPDTAAVKMMGKEAVLWYTKYNDVKGAATVMPAMLNYELSWDRKPVANTRLFTEKWNNLKYIRKEGSMKWEKISLPKFEYATADNFFYALDKSTKQLPEAQGERPNVWLYIHGPSHEMALTASRQGDVLLPAAECMSAMRAMIDGGFGSYPYHALNQAWKAKIYPDHGWGGNGGDLTDNLFLRKYEYAKATAEKVIDQQAAYLASMISTNGGDAKRIVLFNTTSFARKSPVTVDVQFEQGYAHALCLTNLKGGEVAMQLSDVDYYGDMTIRSAKLHFVASLPAVGYTTYKVSPSNAMQKIRPAASNKVIENQFYKIEFAEGGIRQIWDKESNMGLLRTDKFLGGEVITMHSYGNGAGEFDAVQQPDMEGFDKTSLHAGKWTVEADGPVYTQLMARTPIRHAVVEQRIRIYHNIKQIDFDIDLLNWEQVMYRDFRMMLPLAMNQAKVSYEVPYGVLRVGEDEMPGAAGERYYVENKLQHPRGIGGWIGALGDGVAVTLASSVAVADYVDPTDNPVDYAVLQPILLASRRSCHPEGNNFSQPGDHHFHFALTSHAVDNIRRNQFGTSANTPLLTVFSPIESKKAHLAGEMSLFGIDNANVNITAIKKCEDDDSYIVRMYNTTDAEQRVHIKCGERKFKIVATNLIEEEQGEVDDIVLGKYAIETFKLIFQ
ncbi:MAG: glycosyl hydrolase-related protein [Muribaculaceae bacterium]